MHNIIPVVGGNEYLADYFGFLKQQAKATSQETEAMLEKEKALLDEALKKEPAPENKFQCILFLKKMHKLYKAWAKVISHKTSNFLKQRIDNLIQRVLIRKNLSFQFLIRLYNAFPWTLKETDESILNFFLDKFKFEAEGIKQTIREWVYKSPREFPYMFTMKLTTI